MIDDSCSHCHLREERVHHGAVFRRHVLVQNGADLAKYDDDHHDDEEELGMRHVIISWLTSTDRRFE